MALVVAPAVAPAQSKAEREEREILETPEDPFTERDPERMRAAGIVAYAPFRWSATHRTEDIDRVLGEGRILWLETEHFVIGSAMRGCDLPDKPDERKALQQEVRALREVLPEVPRRVRRLSPWLRLHLYARRAEQLYAEFAELVGFEQATEGAGTAPPNGPYLGMARKFQIVLFQKKSDLARFLDRFVGVRADHSFRFYEHNSHQMLLASALEIMDEPDEPAFHSHFVYTLTNNLVSGYRNWNGAVPLWLIEGLSHYYSRRVDTDFINVKIGDDEAVDEAQQHKWRAKVRARAQHEGASIPFTTMAGWREFEDLTFQGHIQSFSRVDFLMARGADRLGQLLGRVKQVTYGRDGSPPDPAMIDAIQQQALLELFELDAGSFDEQWRLWVLETYPRR